MNNRHDKSSPAASARRIDPRELCEQGDPRTAFAIREDVPTTPVAAPRRLAFLAKTVLELRETCGKILDALGPVARRRGMALEAAQFASQVWANETLLRRVLISLGDYQIQRASRGSTITLMTTPLPGATEIRVIDWGDDSLERIPREAHTMRERLALEMMPSNRRLGVCEFVIESQGGAIWFERGADGSAFYVRLPHGS